MRRFLRDILNAILIGTLIYLAILLILYLTGGLSGSFDLERAWREYYKNMIFSIIIYFANVYTWRFIDGKLDEDFYKPRRLLIGVAGNFVASVVAIFVSRFLLSVVFEKTPVSEFLSNENPRNYYISLTIAMIVVAIYHAFYYYKHWQEKKVKEQKIIAGTASAKFDALKNQLDPHFLFNSLNVLTSLIEEDPYQAQKFTTSLSKVYRYVLEQKNKDLVSVDEELQFAKTYVRLLKMRFEDSIILDIPDASSDPEAKIVPLSLQLLLENAVKHNVVSADRPLHIKVFEKDGMLVVSNNLQEKQVVKKSSGVGLQNIKQRYAILSDRRVVIGKEAQNFSVRLPILTKQVSVMKTQQIVIDDKVYKNAKEHVQKIKGFYGNLLAYCIVIPCLAILNYQTGNFPWIFFPTLGWGFGVVAHGLEAFDYNPLFGKGWEEQKIRKYMDDDTF